MVKARGLCAGCYQRAHRAGEIETRKQRRLSNVDREARTAICSEHGAVKLRVRIRKNGAEEVACRICDKGDPEKARERRRRNGSKTYERNRVKYSAQRSGWRDEYTEADYAADVEAAEGRCAICREVPDSSLCIDHDHATGKVRGLLCTGCNLALGLMRDDPATLRRAVAYLAHNRATPRG